MDEKTQNSPNNTILVQVDKLRNELRVLRQEVREDFTADHVGLYERTQRMELDVKELPYNPLLSSTVTSRHSRPSTATPPWNHRSVKRPASAPVNRFV